VPEDKDIVVNERIFEYEKKKLSKQFKKYGRDSPTAQDVYTEIKKKILKFNNKETIDLPHRNFLLPSYHSKTYFKSGRSMQM